MVVKYDFNECPQCDYERILNKLVEREREAERVVAELSQFAAPNAGFPRGNKAVEMPNSLPVDAWRSGRT